MRSQIRETERGIEAVRDKLDEEIGRLADSLDSSKLDGMRPRAVAKEIFDYMENKQDGWGCPGESASFLAPPIFFILKTQFPFMLEQLVSIFIPPAFAETKGLGAGHRVRRSVSRAMSNSIEDPGEVSCPVGKEWKCLPRVGCQCRPCESNEGSGGDKCVNCWEQNKIAQNGECIDCPENTIRTENNCEPCASPKRIVEGECKCPEGRVQDSGGRCCARNKNFLDEGECVATCPPERPKAENNICTACKGERIGWKNNQCQKCADNEVLEDSQCKVCNPPKRRRGSDCVDCPEGHVGLGVRCVNCWERDEIVKGGKCAPCSLNTVRNGNHCTPCVSPREIIGGECKCPDGMVQESGGGECIKTEVSKQAECEEKPGEWKWINNSCICSSITHEAVNGNCKTKKAVCEEAGDNWYGDKCHKCEGATPKWSGSECVACKDGEAWSEADGDCSKECSSGQIVKAGKCDCPKWKKDEAFGNKGKVNGKFCDNYAKDKRDCKKALSAIKRHLNRLATLEKRQEKLEDEESKAEMSALTKKTSKTEASGLCFDCLKRTLAASRPSTGQQIGNVLQALTGVGLGLVGYNLGKRAQMDANTLRIQNGFEVQNDYYSFMGAEAGIPYLAGGLYGMTRVNTPVGGWACSPTISQGHHPYHGQGFRGRYY